MDAFCYGAWRFLLYIEDIPGINTYNLIDEWVGKRVLIPGEEMTAEKWEKRIEEWTIVQLQGNYI